MEGEQCWRREEIPWLITKELVDFQRRHTVLFVHFLRYIGQRPHHVASTGTRPLRALFHETHLTMCIAQIDFVGVGSRFGYPAPYPMKLPSNLLIPPVSSTQHRDRAPLQPRL